VIDATNACRSQNGLAPLKPKVQLIVIARTTPQHGSADKFGDSDQNGHILDGHNFEYASRRAAMYIDGSRKRRLPTHSPAIRRSA
jgi:hypothetical protein